MRNVLVGLALIAALSACQPKEVILPGERFDVTVPLADSIPVEGEAAPRACATEPQRTDQPARARGPVRMESPRQQCAPSGPAFGDFGISGAGLVRQYR
jgi:hypothetical protein